jgi:hypothetical protein
MSRLLACCSRRALETKNKYNLIFSFRPTSRAGRQITSSTVERTRTYPCTQFTSYTHSKSTANNVCRSSAGTDNEITLLGFYNRYSYVSHVIRPRRVISPITPTWAGDKFMGVRSVKETKGEGGDVLDPALLKLSNITCKDR